VPLERLTIVAVCAILVEGAANSDPLIAQLRGAPIKDHFLGEPECARMHEQVLELEPFSAPYAPP
jgi:hypothetical protein